MHRRAARRRRTHGADSGHSWVTWGGSGSGGAADARRAGYRAGHRSAQDLFGPGPPAFCPSSSADGRTVGGCADEPGVCACGGRFEALFEARDPWNSLRTDWVQQRLASVRSLTIQFLRVAEGVVHVEVLKVLFEDWVQQRMWSRSLLFLLVEVSKVFFQARVPHRADFFKMRMRDFKGFSHFSQPKKSTKVTRQSIPRVPANVQLIQAERPSNGSSRGVW